MAVDETMTAFIFRDSSNDCEFSKFIEYTIYRQERTVLFIVTPKNDATANKRQLRRTVIRIEKLLTIFAVVAFDIIRNNVRVYNS